MATNVKQLMEAANAAVPRVTPAQAREMVVMSGKTLKEMGYGHVYNLGAFNDWADSGGAVEPAA